jgi:predicted S18 family serine protease
MILLDKNPRVAGLPFEYSKTKLFDGGSAGLATVIAAYQAAGGPAGPGKFAATGAINADQTIGPIGGIALKARAVSDSGIKYFLVPAQQAAEARRAVPELEVVPVKTVADAVEWLTAQS